MAIFGHLSDDIFQLFSGSNRHLYAKVLSAVYQEFFGGTGFSTPLREEVIHFLVEVVRENADLWADEETLEDLPPPPGRRGKRLRRKGAINPEGADLLARKGCHVYARLLQTGWLEEEDLFLRTQVEMPPAAMALIDQLTQIEQGIDQLFAGVIAEIRAALNAIKTGDERSLLALPKACDTAIAFVKRLRAIKSQLRYVRRALTESENIDERLRYFMEEFIGQIVITDYRALLTTDHPYNHRHDILRAIDEIRGNQAVFYDLARKYVEASIANDTEDAMSEVASHLTQIEGTLSSIDEFMYQLDRFRRQLEEKLRNTVEYMDRADDRYCNDVVSLIQRLDKIDQRCKAIGRTPGPAPSGALPSHRLWAPDLNAGPREKAPPVKPRTIKKRKEDPVQTLYKNLTRQFANLFAPQPDETVRRFLEQHVPPSGTEARYIYPKTLEEFLIFDDIRRRRLEGKPARRQDKQRSRPESWPILDGQFSVAPAEGCHDSEWMRCPNFTIVRHDTVVEEDRSDA
jgi:hypothetical protein